MATKNSTAIVADDEELDLDKKVVIKSIATWNTGFSRITDGVGDVTIAPNGSVKLSRNEIIAQVQNGNKLFSGTDGLGSHATYVITDKPTRFEVGFETDDSEQCVFSDKKIADIFKKSNNAFEFEFTNEIVTRAEKAAAMGAIKRLKLNDYAKIRFVEKYTGYTLE